MKLCADILYWRLKEKLTTVTQRGKGGSALSKMHFVRNEYECTG